MARSLRREYPNAIYHVINRGNYRSDVFDSEGAAAAFVKTLSEATARFSWRLGAYVVMRNHFHLALQTPEPNLSVGMQWLQVTFASRFNRMRGQQGHLFQGRYRSFCLENAGVWARVADYIHLNPVRAGIVSVGKLDEFRWSSLRPFIRGSRFAGLQAHDWLATLGLPDSPAGWLQYQRHLEARVLSDETAGGVDREELSRGWAIGSEQWKQDLAQEPSIASSAVCANEDREPKEVLRLKWEVALNHRLSDLGRTDEDLRNSQGNSQWKVALADQMQREYGASVTWLSAQLQMGKPATARGYLWQYRRNTQNTT